MSYNHQAKKRAHERKRYWKFKAAGICVSCETAPARPGKVECAACSRDHVARETRRQNRFKILQRQLGLCRYCRTREAMPGTTICGFCQERRSEQSTEYRLHRVLANQCVDCGKPTVDGKRRCTACLIKNRDHQRAYRAAKHLKAA